MQWPIKIDARFAIIDSRPSVHLYFLRYDLLEDNDLQMEDSDSEVDIFEKSRNNNNSVAC